VSGREDFRAVLLPVVSAARSLSTRYDALILIILDFASADDRRFIDHFS
jgi:hypothetical protein